MGFLNTTMRPWILFDSTNPQHRQWYYQFLSTSSWRHCPVRFAAGDEGADLLGWIQRDLLLYYGEQEFNIYKTHKVKLVNPVLPMTTLMDQVTD